MARKRLTMKKIKEVMRLKYEAGLSNRAVASACRVSNSTVGEYLKRAEAVGLSWPVAAALGEMELWYRLYPERPLRIQPVPRHPMPNWEQVAKEKRRKGVTLRLLWQEYKQQYPDGYQYSQFCEHFRRWKKRKIDPSLRKDHKGGEEMEVDYAGLKIPMTDPVRGEVIKLSVFVATLPASNYIYAEVHQGQNQRNWNNAHVRAFEHFGGVVKIVIPDNLKTGVTRPNYYEPGVTLAYQELAEHYQVAILPTRTRKPTDKGACENAVQNVERWIIAPLRNRLFFSLEDVQRAVRELLEILNNKVMAGVSRSRRQQFEAIDLPNLRPLPERPYEYAERKTATVHIDYHVEFDDHLYSVPYPLIHQKVDIRATENIVEISHQGKIVAIHARNSLHGRYSTLREHMPANHQFMKDLNAQRLVEWAEKIGPQTGSLIQAALRSRAYPEQAFRTCLGVLRLAHKYEHTYLEAACQIAREAGDYSYKSVEQELVTLLAQAAVQPSEPSLERLPGHANIRGAEYYRERSPR
jgi:transposase